MCDETITPQVPGVDKLPANAKVFIEGKNRPLFVNETADELQTRFDDVIDVHGTIRVTNINGEITVLPTQRVVSIVATERRGERVEVSGAEFTGKRITVRGLRGEDVTNLRGPLGIDPARYDEGTGPRERTLDGTPIDYFAIAIGEDLGEAEIAIVNMKTGETVWSNPAEPVRSLRRVVKAMRLLNESLAITDAEAAQAIQPAAE